MTALVIVVIDENKSGHGSHVAPCWTNRFEVAERMGIFSNAEAVFKLGYTTNTGVFTSCDWFSTLIDDLLSNKWSSPSTESGSDIEVRKSSVDDFKITGPHVFTSVNPESCDSQINCIAHITLDHVSNMVLSLIQIDKIDKTPVPCPDPPPPHMWLGRAST